LDSNVFINNIQTSSSPKALSVRTPASLTGNRFVNLQPPTASSVRFFTDPVNPDTGLYVMRYSQFGATDYAVSCSYVEADAILNYWGHVSGPYNALYNPDGQGARVDDHVLFDPWSPDTNFFPDEAAEARSSLPDQFEFSTYPNPFNNIVHFTLTPAEVQLVNVKLYDVLGREVAEVWRGALAFQREIRFDASQLASGIYFARVADTISRKQMAMHKLVLLK
jgi:hypothetical protein